MNWKEIEPQVCALQSDIVDAMNSVREMGAEESRIPAPGLDYDVALQMLAGENYEVVVCGEVKKGKSSFINALLGQRLLPVNSDVATAQVFRIKNSEEESYSLVFTDRTTMQISRDELEVYGSQVSYNTKGTKIGEGKVIDHIEVNTPAPFLPKGVNIVDTPGLGALYRSHEAITRSYVKRASAVIFILDPYAPITEMERSFINEILDITPYIIFILTKADLYKPSDFANILQRNQETLSAIYEARGLRVPKIHPFSSEMMMNASEAIFGAEQAYRESGYCDVIEDVHRLIFQSVGLLRTGAALVETGRYVNSVNQAIADILISCSNDAGQIQKDLEQNKRRLQEDFRRDWSVGGKKRRELEREIDRVCSSVNLSTRRLFVDDGTIWGEATTKINDITSNEDVSALCSSLPETIARELTARWDDISSSTQSAILSEFRKAGHEMSSSGYGANLGTGTINVPKMSSSDILTVTSKGLFGLNAGGLVGGAMGGAIGLFCGPGGAIAGAKVGAMAGAAIGAIFAGDQARIDIVKSKLRDQLRKIKEKMTIEISECAMQFAFSLRTHSIDALEELVRKREKELAEEIDDLVARSKMNFEQKKQETAKWTEIQSRWNEKTGEIRSLIARRKEISEILEA